ncbi:hypothetical protein [Asticcacaulis sp. 201]|uniref:hypothetical protein n=1 Tax=Asticcacaulis sp. 201 TaxID=3028787 RepID=UPI002916FB54|nr:hypothetical protein [Asticcacaulis sp. 201]MDV6330113.1 hypothetical protein [Asticcacaulis sp. 201]
MHDGFDAPAQAPSDFPSDPIFYHDLPLIGGVILIVIMVAVGLTVYRATRKRQWDGFFAHVKSVKLVEMASRRAMDRAYETPGTLTPDVIGLIDILTGKSRECGKAIRDMSSALDKALSGVKEVDAPPGSAIGVGDNNSGTIINIAVSNTPNGNAAPGVVASAVPGGAVAQVVPASPAALPPQLSHAANMYMALNAVHEEWKSTRTMAGALEDARNQLIDQPAWTPPPRPTDTPVRA